MWLLLCEVDPWAGTGLNDILNVRSARWMEWVLAVKKSAEDAV